MLDRFLGSTITVVIAATAVSAAISVSITGTSAQAPALKTSWGEPDLQGIWTDEFDTPLQRPAKYATQEFFTEAQRAELDQSRAAVLRPFAAQPRNNRPPTTATFSSPNPTSHPPPLTAPH